MDKIICVTGPTATGKTQLAVALAKQYNGEVLSCDSMQLYRGMCIGTAAPTPAEMAGVRHHMLGVVDPSGKKISKIVNDNCTIAAKKLQKISKNIGM